MLFDGGRAGDNTPQHDEHPKERDGGGNDGKQHQQGAIKSVLPIVGSGAGDMTLLKVTPEKYENTINQLKKLGFLTKDVDVASTYDRTFYDTMGPVPAP